MSVLAHNNNKAECAAANAQALGQELFESFTTLPINSNNNNTDGLFDYDQLSVAATTALLTPELGYLSSPETFISHEFDHSPDVLSTNYTSPALGLDDFGAHPSEFVLHYAPQLSKESSLFGDVTLFGEDQQQPPILETSLESLATIDPAQVFETEIKPEFAQASELIDVAQALQPIAEQVESQPAPSPKPTLPRTKSIELAEAAIPKQQRGRKRKQAPSEDGDDEADAVKDFSRMTEAEIRVYQRQKNTEAAARSRARKRAAMAAAEDRIVGLEQELADLRRMLAERDSLIASLQAAC